MNNLTKKVKILIFYLCVALIFLTFISLFVGPVKISVSDALRNMVMQESFFVHTILWEIRMPRTLIAILTGGSLGICGAAIQGLFRNPLAEPGIVGISASAALGSVIVMYFGLSTIFSLMLPLGGIVGAFVGISLVYLLAGLRNTILILILAGIAVNIFASSMTSLALNFAPSPYAAMEIVFWMLGSLADRSLEHLFLVSPLAIFGWFIIVSSGKALNALSLGDDTAQSLGIKINLLKTKIILGSALSVGSVVSITGGISFVGLIVPHLIRPLVGHEPQKILIPSALGGAVLVLLADIFIRIIPTNTELQIGVVTSILGIPFFIYIILFSKKFFDHVI